MSIRAAQGPQVRWSLTASSAPASTGDSSSITTAFDGDWGQSHSQGGFQITGSTLGSPATGYLYTPEVYPFYTYLYNSSGHNEQTDGNDGRTAAVAFRTKVYQAGQGDAAAYNASVFVTGARASSTHFLANPAGSLFNGDIRAGQDGVYLNPFEIAANDGGYDAAFSAIVFNLTRTNATGAKSAVWNGIRLQGLGAAACDAMFSGYGKWQTGIDFALSTTDFGTNQAAISLKSGQRIYFNNTAGASGNLRANWRSTVFNTEAIYHDGTNLVLDTSGVLKFGTRSAITTETVTGYITIKDSGGTTRKLAVVS